MLIAYTPYGMSKLCLASVSLSLVYDTDKNYTLSDIPMGRNFCYTLYVPTVRKSLIEMVIYYVTKEKYLDGFEIRVRKHVTENL